MRLNDEGKYVLRLDGVADGVLVVIAAASVEGIESQGGFATQ
jgi:hypothetical protein